MILEYVKQSPAPCTPWSGTGVFLFWSTYHKGGIPIDSQTGSTGSSVEACAEVDASKKIIRRRVVVLTTNIGCPLQQSVFLSADHNLVSFLRALYLEGHIAKLSDWEASQLLPCFLENIQRAYHRKIHHFHHKQDILCKGV